MSQPPSNAGPTASSPDGSGKRLELPASPCCRASLWGYLAYWRLVQVPALSSQDLIRSLLGEDTPGPEWETISTFPCFQCSLPASYSQNQLMSLYGSRTLNGEFSSP